MSPTFQAIISSWSWDLKIPLVLATSLFVYLRGWFVLHRTLPERFPVWRLLAFAGGLLTIWLAVASPLDAFSGLLLSAHMVQHLLLISIAPALILLGAPFLPLLRGLPRKFARDGIGPFLVWAPLRRISNAITHPANCWIIVAIAVPAWHVPAAYDLALRSPAWHKVEHACFLGASLLFWWPVVRPFPNRPRWPLWSVPLYLLAADLLNTALSAILTFSDHVLYPHYLEAPRLFGATALSDQSCAGVIMWVPGSLVFLIPAVLTAVEFLSAGHQLVRPQNFSPNSRLAPARSLKLAPEIAFRKTMLQPVSGSARFDLLSLPLVGSFLRAQAGRRVLQLILFFVVIAVIVDGIFGPQVGSANLAGVLPWTYWRVFVVIALLAAGNLFCMACPFMLVRDLGRRLGLRQRSWPRALRSKWFAVALLALFFWGYSAFNLWDKPVWTAWLVLNYFLVAFVVDAVFRGASFCKYVCPIGQFQFVASLISPLEVKVRTPDICARCKTHDCLRGNKQQRGCEMNLYLPRKAGNFDCTFCLDCVRACPHDNIGVMAVTPAMHVVQTPQPPSVGRQLRRPDIAALVLVFVFAAFANAAMMATPVSQWIDYVTTRLSLSSTLPITSALVLLALVVAPIVLVWGSVVAGRTAAGIGTPARDLIGRFSWALVPLALGMWAAHFLFHILVDWNSVWLVLQRVFSGLGWGTIGQHVSTGVNPIFNIDELRKVQTALLDIGLLTTLYLGWRMARTSASRLPLALRMIMPWSSVAVGLYLFGVWTCLQPMQMRGL